MAAGDTGANNGSIQDIAVLRYNSNGSLRHSRSADDGIQTTAIGGLDDGAKSMAIQTDGKIVVAGYTNNGSNLDFAVPRYDGYDVSQLAYTEQRWSACYRQYHHAHRRLITPIWLRQLYRSPVITRPVRTYWVWPLVINCRVASMRAGMGRKVN